MEHDKYLRSAATANASHIILLVVHAIVMFISIIRYKYHKLNRKTIRNTRDK